MGAIRLDEGLPLLHKFSFNSSGGERPQRLRLFTNNLTLTKASVLANFTEASGMGYAAKTVAGTDWTYTLDTTNHKDTATASYTWTFTSGSGMTIYGWYMVDWPTGMGPATKALIAEKFATPVTIPAGGGTLALTIDDVYQDCA